MTSVGDPGVVAATARVSARQRHRAKRDVPGEQSGVARLALLAAMLIAVGSLGVTAEMPIACTISAVAIAVGYRHSWRTRDAPRSAVGQVLIGVGLLALLVYLISDLFGGAFGGDLPQAHFGVYVAALTSVDVKSRRNCLSHIWHSLILLYIAGLFAWSGVFMLTVVAWGICVAVFMAATRRGAPRFAGRGRFGRTTRVVAVWLATSVALFIALPEFAGRPVAVPLLIGVPVSTHAGEALPPALPLVGSNTAAQGGIDLRARGRFGDEIALHVRSASPSYWRAYSLDVYTGTGWERGFLGARSVIGIAGRDLTPFDEVAAPSDTTLSQSFVVESNLPGQIIGAYPIQSVDVSSASVTEHTDGSVSLDNGLTPGMSYGVVSRVRDLSPERLRALGRVNPVDVDPGDLPLPESVSAPTRALGGQLIESQPTEYDAVIAVQQYLTSHEQYSLDTPRLQSGADAVDQFLFRDHLGFCEQFSSAFAVLLRSQGIPARVAVGYATGDYDRLTGSYTVHNSDAHAWTEVEFPGVGWVPFDASPGFDATPRTPRPGSSLFNLDLVLKVGGVPGGGAAVAAVAVGLAVIALFFTRIRIWVRRRRMDPLLRRYADAQRRLKRRRLPSREPGETIAEHLLRLKAASLDEAVRLAPLASAVETALYATP